MTDSETQPGIAQPLAPGRVASTADICRGTQRFLASIGLASVCELLLPGGRRADIAAIAPSGDIWIVEVKSCLEDFRSDLKWPDYRDYCDGFYFAVDAQFPTGILPATTGLIIADRYGAAIITQCPAHPLKTLRRKQLTALFARTAALRLQHMLDPDARIEAQWTSW